MSEKRTNMEMGKKKEFFFFMEKYRLRLSMAVYLCVCMSVWQIVIVSHVQRCTIQLHETNEQNEANKQTMSALTK